MAKRKRTKKEVIHAIAESAAVTGGVGLTTGAVRQGQILGKQKSRIKSGPSVLILGGAKDVAGGFEAQTKGYSQLLQQKGVKVN